MKIHYQDHYATLMTDESIPCVVAKFTGSASSREHLKEVHQLAIKIFAEEARRFSKLHYLFNIQKARAILPEDASWISRFFHPELFKVGIRYGAVILPESLFTQLVLDDMLAETPKNTLAMKVFENKEEAGKWLRNL